MKKIRKNAVVKKVLSILVSIAESEKEFASSNEIERLNKEMENIRAINDAMSDSRPMSDIELERLRVKAMLSMLDALGFYEEIFKK